MSMDRRSFLKWATAGMTAASATLSACAGNGVVSRKNARVIVVGGGFGGATVAKYLRLWAPTLAVTLIEREPKFISCPQSNLVLGGSKTLEDLSTDYTTLVSKYGVSLVKAEVVGVDPEAHIVATSEGNLPYDRLILSPGVDFLYNEVPGLESQSAQEKIPHAWKAGGQTQLLREQLQAMPDGGVFVMTIPGAPYRCPPGPYERACQVAFYFKQHKPKSKILILDTNPDITSKKGLFLSAWQNLYPGMIEYRPNIVVDAVNADKRIVQTTFDAVQADVLNVIPPQKAGAVTGMAGVADVGGRWCTVDFLTYASRVQKDVHVIGDAISAGLPKSGHIANQTAKVCAAAVIRALEDEAPNPKPVFSNTCYSFVSDKQAMSVAAVYQYDPEHHVMASVEGSSGVSSKSSESEGEYAKAWAKNIWSDMLL